MKIAIIIVTIILILSFIIRNGIKNIATHNVAEFINNITTYNKIANINGVIFGCSLITEVILIGLFIL